MNKPQKSAKMFSIAIDFNSNYAYVKKTDLENVELCVKIAEAVGFEVNLLADRLQIKSNCNRNKTMFVVKEIIQFSNTIHTLMEYK